MKCIVRCLGNDGIAFGAFGQHFRSSSVSMLGSTGRIDYII